MNLTQHKKYPLIKLIYNCVLAAALIVAFVFTLVGTAPQGKLDAALKYDRIYADLQRISRDTHDIGSVGHAELQKWLVSEIENIGYVLCDEDLADCNKSHDGERFVLHKQTKEEGVWEGYHRPVFDEFGAPVYDEFGEPVTDDFGMYVYDEETGESTWISGGVWIVHSSVTNLVATVKGIDPQEKALMITSHYDGARPQGYYDEETHEFVPDGVYPATTDAGIAVASMLEVMRYAKDNGVKNDVIFLLTDGEENQMKGAKAFIEMFESNGLNPVDKIGLIANFEATGTSGTLLMFETGANAAATVKAFAPTLGTVNSNSLMAWVYDVMPNYTDMTVYKEHGLTGINFANTGGGQNYHTTDDSMENLSEALLKQNANLMLSLYNHFGNYDFDKITDGGRLVYFNFYDLGMLMLPVWAMYIFVGLMLAGIIAVIVVNRKNLNRRGILNILKAVGIVLASVLLAVGVTYLFALIMNAITGVWLINKYSSFGIVFGMMFFALVVMAAIQILLAKLCKVTKQDAKTAQILLLFLFTAVLTFALPEASFIFFLPALIGVVALVLENTIKNEEAHTIIKDLRLPLLGTITALTSTVTFSILIAYALGTLYAPALMFLPLLALCNLPPLLYDIKVGRKNNITSIQSDEEIVET